MGKGQAEYITKADRNKIRGCFIKDSHKAFWDIARFTGERWGAIAQLRVDDVYARPGASAALDKIIYRAEYRKQSAGKKQSDRVVEVVEPLRVGLRSFTPPRFGYLFPSPSDPTRHISNQAMDKALRNALRRAGLDHKGISGHSTRVSVTTDMVEAGIDFELIRDFMGWSSIEMVGRYARNSPKRRLAALAAII